MRAPSCGIERCHRPRAPGRRLHLHIPTSAGFRTGISWMGHRRRGQDSQTNLGEIATIERNVRSFSLALAGGRRSCSPTICRYVKLCDREFRSFHGLSGGKLPISVWRHAEATGVQPTALPGSDAARRTGDGEEQLRHQVSHFHRKRMR
jgi:hypothetical protein